MEKSKLGISVGLFAALLYFIGAAGSILAIMIAAGYVLIAEENSALRKTAVKALILVIALWFISFIIGWVLSLFSTFMGFLPNWEFIFVLRRITNSIISIINTVVRLLVIFIPVGCAFRAYKGKDIKIGWIDKIIDGNFDK
jgi:uncharacterized membrane protein